MYQVDIDGKKLTALTPTTLSELNLTERFDLQEWIEQNPEFLGEDLLIIQKELELSFGARLDLLAIDRAGNLVIVELKRDDSGRNVEWQAIRYASYVSSYTNEEIFAQYAAYRDFDRSEAEEQINEFVQDDLDHLNDGQRIILCARTFHSDVASAVLWLRDFNLDVTCIRIQPFVDASGRLFVNPDTIIPLPEAKDFIVRKEKKEKQRKERPAWSGYWFVNVGEGESRTWEDNLQYGYLSAGNGVKYSKPLYRLEVGDKVFAYIKKRGYVGYGEVTETACPIREFYDAKTGKSLLEAPLKASQAAHHENDDELCEHAIGVRWIKTFPRDEAKTFPSVFANQNIVCKLRHPETFEFLKREFGTDNGMRKENE